MENGNVGDKPLMQHLDTKHAESKPVVEVSKSALSYSSSSSSSSSSDSSLDQSTNTKDSLGDLYIEPERDASLSPRPASSSSLDFSAQTPSWSMMSGASPRAGTGNPIFPDFFEWNHSNASPMKSPPIPTMGQPPGYDPNRIPSSIFSSKPNSTMEWSVASNESLFSIQMGNNSFSRDHYNMLYKSGELTKPDEWSNSPSNPYYSSESNDRKSFSSTLPPLIEVAGDDDGKNESALLGPNIQEKNVETPKMVPKETTENNIRGKTTNVIEVELSATTSNRHDGRVVPLTEDGHIFRRSDESGNNGSSFAFPVLVNDGGKTGSLKVASGKVEIIQSQPELKPVTQPQPEPDSQPKAANNSWFSCFTCWPRCC